MARLNPRLTDRERCMMLEARVAELEEEVAAYKAYLSDPEVLEPGVIKIWQALAKAHAGAGGRTPATMLAVLLAHPGSPVHRDTLFCRSRGGLSRTDDRDTCSVRVRMVALRRALLALGFGDAIQTLPGEGWMISTAQAETIKAALGV